MKKSTSATQKPSKKKELSALTLEERAEEIKKAAEASGLADNFYFETTFDRYLTQIKILAELKRTIEESETLIEKEYVKGRGNLYTHPAITEYNRTTDSANKTVTCLLKIIESFKAAETIEDDPLMRIITGE